MIKSKIKTFSLQPKIIKLLCNCFNTENISEAVYKGLIGFLSNTSYGKRMDDFALHQLLTVEERTTIKKYSVRITKELEQMINIQTTTDTIFNVVVIMLANYLYYSNSAPSLTMPAKTNFLSELDNAKADISTKLLTLLGSKWNKKMQSAINHILQTSEKIWCSSIEPFVGALGIFTNFRFAFNEIINDMDLQKVNLYRAIQAYMDVLLLKMLCKPVDEQTFIDNQEQLKAKYNLSNSKVNLEAAASFLFSNLLSVWSSGSTFKGTYKSYRKKLDNIALLCKRLKDTEICGDDAFKLIRKHMEDSGAIFIIDPPYLDTDVYSKTAVTAGKEQKIFDYAKHVELAKLLRKTHQEYGNDFIYFCRITAPHKFDSKPDKDKHDRHMEGRIDDLYWGYGHYYIDVPLLKDNSITAIERIITSFDFSGAQPYGNGRGQN